MQSVTYVQAALQQLPIDPLRHLEIGQRSAVSGSLPPSLELPSLQELI